MFQRRYKFHKIDFGNMVLGLILLAGILIMIYGFINNFHTALFLGLVITASGSVYGIYWVSILKAAHLGKSSNRLRNF